MSKRVVLRNTADTISSFLQNDATVQRTWLLPDKDMTVAAQADLGFYNVMNYGAVGDGSTDDSAAINALIAIMPYGQTLFFPGGRQYRINSSLAINKEMNVVGEGSRSRLLTANNIHVFDFNSGSPSVYLDHVKFRDIGIQRTGTATSGSAIKLTRTFQARFHNVHTYDFYNNIDINESFEWCITDCNFNGYWNAGLKLANSGSNADRGDASIVGSYFIPVTRNCNYSIHQNNGGGLKIVNTKFNYGAGGQANYHYYYTGTESTSDLMISNCSFENHILCAIRIGATATFRKVAITGNQLALGNNSSKYIIIDNVDDGIIMGNQFHSQNLAITGIEITNADDWTINNQYTGIATPLSRVGTTNRIYNEVENRLVIGEVPSGSINSSNLVFTTANTGLVTNKESLFYNGLLQRRGTDYTMNYTTGQITMAFAPVTGSSLQINYLK